MSIYYVLGMVVDAGVIKVNQNNLPINPMVIHTFPGDKRENHAYCISDAGY